MMLYQIQYEYGDHHYVEADSMADAIEAICEHYNRTLGSSPDDLLVPNDIESCLLMSDSPVIRKAKAAPEGGE